MIEVGTTNHEAKNGAQGNDNIGEEVLSKRTTDFALIENSLKKNTIGRNNSSDTIDNKDIEQSTLTTASFEVIPETMTTGSESRDDLKIFGDLDVDNMKMDKSSVPSSDKCISIERITKQATTENSESSLSSKVSTDSFEKISATNLGTSSKASIDFNLTERVYEVESMNSCSINTMDYHHSSEPTKDSSGKNVRLKKYQVVKYLSLLLFFLLSIKHLLLILAFILCYI